MDGVDYTYAEGGFPSVDYGHVAHDKGRDLICPSFYIVVGTCLSQNVDVETYFQAFPRHNKFCHQATQTFLSQTSRTLFQILRPTGVYIWMACPLFSGVVPLVSQISRNSRSEI